MANLQKFAAYLDRSSTAAATRCDVGVIIYSASRFFCHLSFSSIQSNRSRRGRLLCLRQIPNVLRQPEATAKSGLPRYPIPSFSPVDTLALARTLSAGYSRE